MAFGWAFHPRRSTFDDGIDVDEKFSGAGDAGDLMGLSGRDQAFIDRDKLGVHAGNKLLEVAL